MHGSVLPVTKPIGITFRVSAGHRYDSDEDKENQQEHLGYGENKLGFAIPSVKWLFAAVILRTGILT
jgi:hypothetical protein